MKYLKKKGYKEVSRNYSKKWGEIDLIVEKGETLVFVEVKTISIDNKVYSKHARSEPAESVEGVARETDYYMPEDHIFPDKLKRIERAINSFLNENNLDEDIEYQIDVVSIVLDKDTVKPISIEHLENVF